MSNFKAQAHMRELKQRLSLSLSGAVFTDALDVDGFPSMHVSRLGESISIKITALGNAGRVDGLGLPQRVYSPHECQLLQAVTPADYATRFAIIAACGKLGMKLEIWQIDPAPSSFDLTGASKVAEIKSDEVNPMTQSQ
jgi:hypothetical protein